MIHLGLSGGGLKGIGQLGILEQLSLKPNILSGISVGSIISMLYACILEGLLTWDQVKDIFFTLKPEDVFSVHPYGYKGSYRGIKSFIDKDVHSLGKQDTLDKTFSKLVTKELFEAYKYSKTSPDIYVGYVDYRLGDLVVKNLKDQIYNDAMNIIKASSHVPVATEAVKMFNSYCFDGGLIDHCISGSVIDLYENKITHNINIFSRPNGNYLELPDWEPENVLTVGKRTIEIGISRISRDDERYINLACKHYNIKNYSIYLPTVLDNMYDFKQSNLYRLYLAGKKQGIDFNKSWQY